MIIYLILRLGRLSQLVLPRKLFLATYAPVSEEERAQSEKERNMARRAAWLTKKYLG